MIAVPFKAEHYWALEPQEAQAYMRDYANKDGVASIEHTNAFSVLDGDKVLICYGWMPIYSTRALVWAYLSKDIGPHLHGVTKMLRSILDVLPYKRIEMEVDCEFEQGHRWAKLLGFTMEAERLRGYRLDGGDSSIYARVR